MIDGTQKPKIPSKFAKRAARYNELGLARASHFITWPFLHDYGLKCLTFYGGSEQQATIVFFFVNLKLVL